MANDEKRILSDVENMKETDERVEGITLLDVDLVLMLYHVKLEIMIKKFHEDYRKDFMVSKMSNVPKVPVTLFNEIKDLIRMFITDINKKNRTGEELGELIQRVETLFNERNIGRGKQLPPITKENLPDVIQDILEGKTMGDVQVFQVNPKKPNEPPKQII